MNRARRSSKPFVSGGIYNPNEGAKPGVQFEPQPKPAQQQANSKEPVVDVKPVEVSIVESNETMKDDDDVVEILSEENGKIPFKKIFQKRKKSSERAREKKIRQNRQLRKAMLPKNALMALNEVKGVVISDFVINSNVGSGFTAVVTVNDSQYEGKGSSKMAAKTNACEKALRDYIISRMAPKPKKTTNDPDNNEPMEVSEDAQSETNSVYENNEDDLPMINLASFAIFKLFTEWEKEGFFVPEMHPNPAHITEGDKGAPATAAGKDGKEAKKLPIRNDLPPNWEEMHPATLLCMMRPGINYTDQGSIGEKPNVLQRLGVTIDGQEFVAEGRSKKIARRSVAVEACNTLFGTTFKRDES